jgi:hypothetical protein
MGGADLFVRFSQAVENVFFGLYGLVYNAF